MSDSSAQAVWHVVRNTVRAAVTVNTNQTLVPTEAPDSLQLASVSASTDVGSVVQSLLRSAPHAPVAVLLEASTSSLLRLVPHLPALAKSPVVFHILTHAQHADVLQLRQSGFAMLYSSTAAEAEAHALVAHQLATRTHTGVIHFFDEGALTSLVATQALQQAVPTEATPAPLDEAALDAAFAEAARVLHREVVPYRVHGTEEATAMAVVLGAGAEKLAERAPLQIVELHLVRPLLPERLVALVPASVQRVAVLEQTSQRSTRLAPVFVDVASAFQHVSSRKVPKLVSGQLGAVDDKAGTALKDALLASSLASSLTIGAPQAPEKPRAVVAVSQALTHEHAYHIMLQQLFHERLQVVNAPRETSDPASLSPEYALGQVLAQLRKTDEAVRVAERLVSSAPAPLAEALRTWLSVRADGARASAAVAEVQAQLAEATGADAEALRALAPSLTPVSRWIVGSDAWAYDTGMGGLHHVMASQRNMNMLIFDTVPYSKRNEVPLHERKKDIGLYAMNYGGVYVASTALYSDYTQVVQALTEADRFDGPSIVLAHVPYDGAETPALEVLRETKLAVDSGYWPLYRWNPSADDGQVFRLDSVRVRQQLQDFLDRQSHLTLLANERPALPYDLAASQGAALREKQRQKAKEAYDQLLGALEGPPLLVLYASDGGAAEKVAHRLTTRAKLRGLGARVLTMDDYPLEELASEPNVVFVTSTAGQGEPPQNGRLMMKALVKQPAGLLTEATRFAVFGMGDSHYWPRPEDAHFYNKPGKDLYKRLTELGASPLVALGLGDDQDADGWQTGYKAWEPQLWKALGVDSVTVTESEPEPITNEHIKIASNYLRGTIAQGLLDESTGAIAETDTQLTKFHGTYLQYDRDTIEERKAAGLEPAYGFMVRVRMPAGVCTPEQWLQLDQVAEDYGGIKSLKITTRQTVQYHMILKRHMKAAMQGINKSLLDTIAACGDVNRNVMCSPNPQLSEVHEAMYEFSKRLSDFLLPRMNAYHEIWLDKGTDSSSQLLVGGAVQDYEPLYGPYYLPRKFKIAVALPPRNDVDVFAHDIGLIAIADESTKQLLGFNVAIGGGMGVTHSMKATYPRLGSVIGFVGVEDAYEVCRQVLLIQRDTGNRQNRKQARLKYTIDKYWGGADKFRDELERRLGYKLQEARPYRFDTNTDEYGWKQDYRGRWHCTLWLENGRVIDEPGRPFRTGLRELARIHRGVFRLTPNQHIIVSDVDESEKPRIEAHLREYKMDNWDHTGLRLSASACVAFPTCGLAMAESERYIFKLVDKIERIYLANGLQRDEITMRMTGCPNGCARPWVAEIAFVGKAPGTYVMCLGGSHAGDRLNKIFRESVGEKEILEIMEVLIPRYARERLEGERFGDWVIRAGIIAATTHGAAFYDHVDTSRPLVPAA
ncbi:assimilatory sulfite reductase (NADPH) [Malassezia equina]|uniref:assimilatory sulfite reductase (NADPH) n=1 Tax=Malassezia equina TaxID=1381935 RepID=A0AAF0IYP7_9BASI|nr:assimilatory sulfite reductase (NADPH) [Malassezia equina]